MHDIVVMYISRASWPSSNGKAYPSIYLRESYHNGPHVRKRNIATRWSRCGRAPRMGCRRWRSASARESP
jgi:hypothetical protein